MSGDGQLALVQSGIFLLYFKLLNWVSLRWIFNV